uniref:Uncharacterized protein n=1 Tax=Solanum lycopersicum TaxID=4081 RepID=A0A3Q7JJW5_SOLLC
MLERKGERTWNYPFKHFDSITTEMNHNQYRSQYIDIQQVSHLYRSPLILQHPQCQESHSCLSVALECEETQDHEKIHHSLVMNCGKRFGKR